MKKIRFISLIASSVLVLVCFLFTPVVIEASANGGAVQTNGVIGFYEEDTSESSTSESSTSESSDSGSISSESITSQSTLPPTDGTTKPTGKYPSTGELVKSSLTISGIALLVIAVIFLIWKKRQEKEDQRRGN